ncbi:MAG: DUF2852 domain-containing protein [Alphaproteobacteria bacterium]|nr:DUF2852 domain-containing protein [Alphaproteobacteria bacterium]
MTYDKNNSESDASSHHHGPHGPRWGAGHDAFGWARQPGFHPLKAVATVAAFAVLPPLGVLTLGYFLWTSRHGWQGGPAMAGGPGMWRGRCGGRGMRGPFTGNQAFDEHQMEQINKLREERRAFQEHRAEQRRKRDREAFDAFRAAQAAKPAEGNESGH